MGVGVRVGLRVGVGVGVGVGVFVGVGVWVGVMVGVEVTVGVGGAVGAGAAQAEIAIRINRATRRIGRGVFTFKAGWSVKVTSLTHETANSSVSSIHCYIHWMATPGSNSFRGQDTILP